MVSYLVVSHFANTTSIYILMSQSTIYLEHSYFLFMVVGSSPDIIALEVAAELAEA